MAFQKNLDSDFNDYHVPHIPRAARSVRRRSSLKSKAADQKTYAFDLLAIVAGKLLSKGEDSPPSVGTSFPKEQPPLVEDSVEIKEELEQRSLNRDFRERNFLFTELVRQDHDSKFQFVQNDPISRPLSGITNSDGSEKYDDCKLRIGILDVESSDFKLSRGESRKPIKLDSDNASNNRVNKTSTLVSSADSVKFPFCRDHAPWGSFLVNNVNLINNIDDDDDNKFFESSTRNKGFRTLPRFGIRKSSASKDCSKLTSNVKDDERYNSDDTERCNYLKKKECLKRQRSIKDYPFKKRKLYDSSSVSNYDEISCGLQNDTNGGLTSSNPALQGVKLKIKSFRVPELIIEISETATVGSLKRTVMEAVNSVLGDGLQVGVIVQGKKIRDENKTLFQTGISRDNKMDTTLGFAFEPNPVQAPIQLCTNEQPHQLLRNNPQPLARYPAIPVNGSNAIEQGNTNTPLALSGNINYNNFIESDNDSAPSPRGDVSLHKTAPESKALVVVPNNNMRPDALDIGPLRKCKRSESAQRRIRRPFAVVEVEALVQAVEKLGTGRWRDVKLISFDNAKHRTYVDLKDKWKTLVHTARISPQQRRGEPVPQELLDRVLAAHSYWSHHQSKQQQLKPKPDTTLL